MLQILLVDDERDAVEALEWKLNNYKMKCTRVLGMTIEQLLSEGIGII